MSRPSDREILNKVRDALKALAEGRRFLGVSKHLAGDLAALEIDSLEELWLMLPQLLQEVSDAGPIKCYAGANPPQRSYDEEMKGLELWPCVWTSSLLQKDMWVKFAMKKDGQGHWHYIHVDVHENRPKER